MSQAYSPGNRSSMSMMIHATWFCASKIMGELYGKRYCVHHKDSGRTRHSHLWNLRPVTSYEIGRTHSKRSAHIYRSYYRWTYLFGVVGSRPGERTRLFAKTSR